MTSRGCSGLPAARVVARGQGRRGFRTCPVQPVERLTGETCPALVLMRQSVVSRARRTKALTLHRVRP